MSVGDDNTEQKISLPVFMQIFFSPIFLLRTTFLVPILLGKNSISVAWMVIQVTFEPEP